MIAPKYTNAVFVIIVITIYMSLYSQENTINLTIEY